MNNVDKLACGNCTYQCTLLRYAAIVSKEILDKISRDPRLASKSNWLHVDILLGFFYLFISLRYIL